MEFKNSRYNYILGHTEFVIRYTSVYLHIILFILKKDR